MTVLMQGRAADALAEAQRAADDSPRLHATSAALDGLGRHAEAEASLRLMIDRYGRPEPVSMAETLALLGRHDAAFEWLDKARRAANPAVFGIKGSPQLQPLRNDVRWARRVHELNLPD